MAPLVKLPAEDLWGVCFSHYRLSCTCPLAQCISVEIPIEPVCGEGRSHRCIKPSSAFVWNKNSAEFHKKLLLVLGHLKLAWMWQKLMFCTQFGKCIVSLSIRSFSATPTWTGTFLLLINDPVNMTKVNYVTQSGIWTRELWVLNNGPHVLSLIVNYIILLAKCYITVIKY